MLVSIDRSQHIHLRGVRTAQLVKCNRWQVNRRVPLVVQGDIGDYISELPTAQTAMLASIKDLPVKHHANSAHLASIKAQQARRRA